MTPAAKTLLATMARKNRATTTMAIFAGADWYRTLRAIRALPERNS